MDIIAAELYNAIDLIFGLSGSHAMPNKVSKNTLYIQLIQLK